MPRAFISLIIFLVGRCCVAALIFGQSSSSALPLLAGQSGVDGERFGAAAQRGRMESEGGLAVAPGDNHDPQMDCGTIANGQLETLEWTAV